VSNDFLTKQPNIFIDKNFDDTILPKKYREKTIYKLFNISRNESEKDWTLCPGNDEL